MATKPDLTESTKPALKEPKYPWLKKTPGVYDSVEPATSWKTMSQTQKPHWSVWTVEGTSLEKSQAKLKKLGLSDPWARNEAFNHHIHRTAHGPFKVFKTGFKGGVFLFLVALAIERQFFDHSYKDLHHAHK